MRSASHRILWSALVAGLLATATACSAPVSTGATTKAASDAPAPREETTAPPASSAPAAVPASLSCDTLIPSDTVAALQKQGWAAMQRDFAFGPEPIPGGVECLWSDPATASDQGLLYGWAPISSDDARARQEQLVASGWIREDSDRGVYITADPRASLSRDAEGYGMTYLFGPGWVSVSDTKQGLILIDPQR